MNKLESTIPFDGFYESFISDDIDHQIGQQIEWDSDIYDLNEDEQQVLEDSYLSVNRSSFYKQIAELIGSRLTAKQRDLCQKAIEVCNEMNLL